MNHANYESPVTVALRIGVAPEHPCSYLPGRTAREEVSIDPQIDAALYRHMMDHGFRRSSDYFYRPICEGCHECVPIRVPVERFRPSRSQRRVWRRNADLTCAIGEPQVTDEKQRILESYLRAQHGAREVDSPAEFIANLYRSPIETIEMVYRIGRRIVGAGLVDICPGALSSVYFYFDPAFTRRSPGVYSALREIEACRRGGLPYWYLGFYVRDCRTMSYKAQYRPYELLGPDGVWRAGDDATAPDSGAR